MGRVTLEEEGAHSENKNLKLELLVLIYKKIVDQISKNLLNLRSNSSIPISCFVLRAKVKRPLHIGIMVETSKPI